jgi:hypothetical protein
VSRAAFGSAFDLHLTTERVIHSCYFQKIIKKINKNKSSRNIEISIFFVLKIQRHCLEQSE